MLEVERIDTYYGERQVLWDLSLKVPQGTVVGMLGRNGMGKSTIIRSIMGMTRPRSGVVRFKGEEINHLPSYQIARKGIALVPQGRGVFASLSVKENLTLVARPGQGDDAWTLDKVYDFFPILKERASFHANLLSGGEQQMLVLARALMANPELLIMDEPSEGLAPLVIKQIGEVICRLKGKLTVLLAEQNFNMACDVSDNIYVISMGRVVHKLTPDELRRNEEVKAKLTGV